MTGSSQRSCQADGTWSGNATVCYGKQLSIHNAFVRLRIDECHTLWQQAVRVYHKF